jgi:hypothetical protein
MSEPQSPPGSNEPRNPVATALMIIVGVVLLLPGLCSLYFLVESPVFRRLPANLAFDDPITLLTGSIWLLWIVCFLVAIGGVLLLRAARPRSRT